MLRTVFGNCAGHGATAQSTVYVVVRQVLADMIAETILDWRGVCCCLVFGTYHGPRRLVGLYPLQMIGRGFEFAFSHEPTEQQLAQMAAGMLRSRWRWRLLLKGVHNVSGNAEYLPLLERALQTNGFFVGKARTYAPPCRPL